MHLSHLDVGSDMVLDSGQWTTSVVGKVSPWIDMDSKCATIQNDSVKVIFVLTEADCEPCVSWSSNVTSA